MTDEAGDDIGGTDPAAILRDATLGLIGAARAFLDAAEQVARDPDAAAALAAGLADLARSAGGVLGSFVSSPSSTTPEAGSPEGSQPAGVQPIQVR